LKDIFILFYSEIMKHIYMLNYVVLQILRLFPLKSY